MGFSWPNTSMKLENDRLQGEADIFPALVFHRLLQSWTVLLPDSYYQKPNRSFWIKVKHRYKRAKRARTAAVAGKHPAVSFVVNGCVPSTAIAGCNGEGKATLAGGAPNSPCCSSECSQAHEE